MNRIALGLLTLAACSASDVDGDEPGSEASAGTQEEVSVSADIRGGDHASRAPAATEIRERRPKVPLTPGVYVLEDADCRTPANAAFHIWTGHGLSGSATRDCRATILSSEGDRHSLSNSCVNTYDGSRTAETVVLTVLDQVHFTLDGQAFRSCSMAQVPDALRRLVR